MDTITFLVLTLLVYSIIMPFVAWIVPKSAMQKASGYVSKVIPILGLKELIKSIFKARAVKKTKQK